MPEMTWKTAISKVLDESDTALNYREITHRIIDGGLRQTYGTTPEATVNANIADSIVKHGASSPFVRVEAGTYWLRTKLEGGEIDISDRNPSAEDTGLIQAFGMFWQRDLVLWKNNPKILGKQMIGADEVNLSDQRGVYLLYMGKDVVYVGRSKDRSLGQRLFEHTQDRLQGRWDRFSWFGVRAITDNGNVKDIDPPQMMDTLIKAMESLLIEGLEPPQNRRRGDDLGASEFIQAVDPDIEKGQREELVRQILSQPSR